MLTMKRSTSVCQSQTEHQNLDPSVSMAPAQTVVPSE